MQFVWKPNQIYRITLGLIYIRAKANVKAIFFFDVCRHCCRCSINTQIGNNVTGWKRCHFRVRFCSNINEPLLLFLATSKEWALLILSEKAYDLARLHGFARLFGILMPQTNMSHLGDTKEIELMQITLRGQLS